MVDSGTLIPLHNGNQEIEVSVVIPCLNEAQSVGICVKKARNALKRLGVCGEVVVADNGSTDGSAAIAKSEGARVVHQPVRGYGSAYLAGIGAAQGKYIIMGDADDTYDFSNLEPFITAAPQRLRFRHRFPVSGEYPSRRDELVASICGQSDSVGDTESVFWCGYLRLPLWDAEFHTGRF